MQKRHVRELVLVSTAALVLAASAGGTARADEPLFRTVDLDVGESAEVTWPAGGKARVKLIEVKEIRDDLRKVVRRADVKVEVDGRIVKLVAGIYRLPVTVGRVQIDAPVTAGYLPNANEDHWGLTKAARLRLWPAG